MTNDMKLPEGRACGLCIWWRRCHMLFGCDPKSTTCDWSPSRYAENKPLVQSLKDEA